MNSASPDTLRCGTVAIIGRPNVGKSTLLNSILKEKVSIVSPIPQTTRYQIRGIYTDKRGQIIFIDTPGFHKYKDHLGKKMNSMFQSAVEETDCLLYLVDTSEQTGEEEELIVRALKLMKKPIILGLNKIDLKGKYIDQYIRLWEEIRGQKLTEAASAILLPVSGKSLFNIEKLIDLIFEYLPPGPMLYPQDTLTDNPQKLAIADIIREKLLWVMREELPHSLAVAIEETSERKKGLTYIRANILVERESQKEIVIGKKGHILKKVGTLARTELESLLDQKVFLELFVRHEKEWRNNISLLNEMGM